MAKIEPSHVEAAKKIVARHNEKDLDRGYGQCLPRMLVTEAEIAQIIADCCVSEETKFADPRQV
jgi:hypothetical protein